MAESAWRHDVSDEVWALLGPHLPGQSGQWSGIAKDNRQFINAVFWILHTLRPTSSLPIRATTAMLLLRKPQIKANSDSVTQKQKGATIL